jgi:(p)ppGpp synthase/HD superfamily hydrolase
VKIQGYSDRVTHALAFAAKHHDSEARKGTRAPYFIQPASVALILTRYGCDESVIVAGILYRVVEDWVGAGNTRALLDERIGSKFGHDVLDMLLEISRRPVDDHGVSLSTDERQRDFHARLATASVSAQWVAVADRLHESSTLLADLKRTQFPESVWSRVPGGRAGIGDRHRAFALALQRAEFQAPIMRELMEVEQAIHERPQ